MKTGSVASGIIACGLLFNSSGTAAPTVDERSLQEAADLGGRIQINREIKLSRPIHITRDTILEARNGRAVISGENATRLFNVANNVNFAVIGLILANGRSTNGGAIYNDGGQIVIIDCRFLNNLAAGTEALAGLHGTNGTTNILSWQAGDGGAGGPGQSARGGAIFNRGTLRIWSSTFENNLALSSEGGPGGDGGNVYQTASPGGGGDGGDGADAEGGAIYSDGLVELFSTTFIGNAAHSSAGGQGGSPGTNSVNMYGTRTWGNAGQSGSARGGAVLARGIFRANDSIFRSNQVMGAGGRPGLAGHGGTAIFAWGVDGRDGKDGGDGLGGAVFAEGQATVERTTLQQNSALGGRGGDGGSGGQARGSLGSYPGGHGGTPGMGGSAQGGALAAKGDLVFIAGHVVGNNVMAGAGGDGGHGGAIAGSFLGGPPNGRDGSPAGVAAGGGVFHSGGRLTLSESQVRSNVAQAAGGGRGGAAGIGNYGSANPAGLPGLAAPAGDAWGGGVCALGTAEVRRTTLAFNGAYAATGSNGIAGGGSRKIGYSGRSGAQGGSALGGGGWFGSETRLSESSLVGNHLLAGDGGNGGPGAQGMYTQSRGGSGGLGGQALGAGFHSEASVVAINCTVAGNSATSGNGGAGAGGDSSPFNYNEQPIDSAGGGGMGGSGAGGISIGTNSSAVFSFCTIASNVVVVGDGGFGITNQFHPLGHWGGTGANLGAIAARGIARLSACIVAGNIALNASGNVIDEGYNLCSDTSCGFTDPSTLVSTDPQLLPLADNGGRTPTMVLAANSPARDAVLNDSCPEIDQRGYSRPAGARCDIGAVERDAEPPEDYGLGAIAGRITDGTSGIARVRIRIGRKIVLTDEQGEYRLDGLKPGRYLVQPTAPNCRFQPKFQRMHISEDTTAADFVLQGTRSRR